MKRETMRSISARIVLAAAVLLAAAGSASAGTIGISGTTLIFGADDDVGEPRRGSGGLAATDEPLEEATALGLTNETLKQFFLAQVQGRNR